MAEPDPFLAHCERPLPGDVPPGPQTVAGWLVPQVGQLFHDVRVWIDQRIFLGVLGLPRPDVAALFPRGLSSLLSEFRIHVDIPPGARLLAIEALRHDRRWVEIHRRMLRVVPGLPPATGAGDFCGEEARLRQSTAPLLGFAPVLYPELVPWLVTTLLRRHRREGQPLAVLAAPLLDAVATPVTRLLPRQPFHGFLDHPPLVAPALWDKVTLKGWVFHRERPIVRLLATTGVEHLNTLPHGRPSERVPGFFPEVAHEFTHAAEFLGTVDTSARLPNPATLKVYAELDDGSLHLVFGQRFFQTPDSEWGLPLPPYRRALFLAAARTLHEGLRRRGLRSPLALPTALAWWRAHADYRRHAPRTAGGPRLLATLHTEPAASTGSSRPLRLLLVTHNLNREGAPLFILEYAQWMIRHAGWTIDVVSAREGPLRVCFAQLGCRVTVVDTAAIFAAQRPAQVDRAVAALAAGFDLQAFDLVLANTALSFWAVHLALHVGKPSLFYIHESATIPRLFEKALPPRAQASVAAAFTRATRTCFLTSATSRHFEDHNAHGNFAPIASWIDLAGIAAFRRTHSKAELRHKHGIAASETVIATIGAVIARKGQHILIRAVDHLLRLWPELAPRCRFLLAGGHDSGFTTGLLADLDRLGWRDRFMIVPETSDVFDFYGLADVFVCTSFEESLPRVLLEAMAFELPIVSTDFHGIADIVEDGQEASLVPAGDPLACAHALKRTLDALGTGRTTAPAALRRVRERFDPALVLPGHLALAETVVRG